MGLLPRGTVVEPLEKVVTADGVSFAVNLRRQEGRKQAVKGFVQQHTRSGGGGVEDVLLVEAGARNSACGATTRTSALKGAVLYFWGVGLDCLVFLENAHIIFLPNFHP